MIDGVDSSRNQVGDVFHASLETDLYVNNKLLAHKGADIYGRLANVQEAGKLSGSAELQLELMRIVIDGHDYSLVSSDYSLKGQGRGADTAKKVSWRGHCWSHHWSDCGRRKRRSDWSGSRIGSGRGSAGIHQGRKGESTERNTAGIQVAAACDGYTDGALDARSAKNPSNSADGVFHKLCQSVNELESSPANSLLLFLLLVTKLPPRPWRAIVPKEKPRVNIGEVIKSYRSQRGLSQGDIERRTGIVALLPLAR